MKLCSSVNHYTTAPLNHVGDLFENNGKTKSWQDLTAKLDLNDNKKIYWRQIFHTISCAWNEIFLE